jgi:hypothetical protein
MNSCDDFSMYDHILSAIVVADSSLIMCFVNKECCNVFGCTKEEMLRENTKMVTYYI